MGGYDALLASAEAGNVKTISEWVSYLDKDSNILHSHLVSKILQIKLI